MTERKYVKLLVVDDHEEDCDLIREYAEMFHAEYRIECRCVDNGTEAIEVSKKWQPSVVLVDVHIQDINGFDVLKSFIETGAPVVLTSKSRSLEIAQSAFDHGAVGYFPKTDNPDDFETLIELAASVATPIERGH